MSLGLLSALAMAMADDHGYDAWPLRSNLSDLSFARSEEGRAAHRFAGMEINRYRLYDYYARQARWYLEHPEDASVVLLPFPGLEGGRRGHWGGTNESSTEAFQRTIAPEFGLVTARGGDWGMHYVRGGDAAPSAALQYDTRRPGVRQALAQARFRSSGGAGPGHVDRWGLNLQVDGKKWFTGVNGAWLTVAAQPVAYEGHYLHRDQVIYRLVSGTATLFEAPTVVQTADVSLVRRVVAFPAAIGQVIMSLDKEALTARPIPGGFIFTSGATDQRRFQIVYGRGDVILRPSEDGHGVLVQHAEADTQVEVFSGTASADPTGSMVDAVRAFPKIPVLTLISGGPARWPQAIVVPGRRNADPAAARGAYEIDDLPVPSENPWNVPMTVSGLDFALDGTAYVCTLVGDVWRVSGINDDLSTVAWRRIASGLNLPLGIVVVDKVPYVDCRGQILALRDLNGDQEIDYVERISQMELPPSECGHDLQRDTQGNFYLNASQGIFRLSADGRKLDQVGGGSRNPLGLGLRPDGLVLSDSSEGDGNNGTCTIYESDHTENANSAAKRKRILYLPRGVDNSPGSRLFLQEPRFGPLGDQLIGVSYGTGTWYQILRDVGAGTPQAALIPLPGDFASGSMRVRRNPSDGQVYVAGLDGWGDYAVAEGCLHRIRYNGRGALVPTAWEAHGNGLMLHFNLELAEPGKSAGFFAQQWNVVDTQHTYGSAEYSVKIPGTLGHDRLTITRVLPGSDQRSLFIEMPTLRPAACTQVHGTLRSRSGATLELDIYATINALRPDWPSAAAAETSKPSTLVLPEKDKMGNTYQVITEHFDRVSGRATAVRSVAPEVPWKAEEVTYGWIREHVIERQCFPCHAKGTPNDYSTYEGFTGKINWQAPEKSGLIGMLSTSSMPPYPFPMVAPGVRKAIEDWVRRGAPP